MDRPASLSHTTRVCKYHVVFIPKCRRRTLYAQLRIRLQITTTFIELEEFAFENNSAS